MANLFGEDKFQDAGEEKAAKPLKFRFKCWNDDPQGISNQAFDMVEIDVYAPDLEEALKKVRELVERAHYEVVKIHEPK